MKKVIILLLMIVADYATFAQYSDVETLIDNGINYFGAKEYKESSTCFKKAIEALDSVKDQEIILSLHQMIKKNHWLLCVDSLFEKAKYYSNSGDYELSTKYYE